MTKYQKTLLLNFFMQKVRDLCPNVISSLKINYYIGETFVEDKSLPLFLFFIKNNSAFRLKILSDIVCVDFPGKNPRFTLMYVLCSPYFNSRWIANCAVSNLNSAFSISSIFNSGHWAEREAWDLFGVTFIGNADLRRILTDYGFSGHPLRKDFPLSGYSEVFFSITDQRIVSEQVSFAQEFRNFAFANPWYFTLALSQTK